VAVEHADKEGGGIALGSGKAHDKGVLGGVSW
jgi:hypothetical protein